MSDEKLVIPDPDEGEEATRAERDGRVGWDYVFAFREMVEELEEHDEIVDIEAEVPEPVAKFTVETVENALGIKVPQRIMQLYYVVDGLRLRWKVLEDGEKRPGGGFELFNFARVFDNWVGELWPTAADLDDDEADFLWSLRGFDRIVDPARDEMTVFCVEDEYPSYDLFLHDLETRESRLLAVDLRTYLDLLLETRGTFGWRLLITEDGLGGDEDERRRGRRFYDLMERFFPDADLGRFDDV